MPAISEGHALSAELTHISVAWGRIVWGILLMLCAVGLLVFSGIALSDGGARDPWVPPRRVLTLLLCGGGGIACRAAHMLIGNKSAYQCSACASRISSPEKQCPTCGVTFSTDNIVKMLKNDFARMRSANANFTD